MQCAKAIIFSCIDKIGIPLADIFMADFRNSDFVYKPSIALNSNGTTSAQLSPTTLKLAEKSNQRTAKVKKNKPGKL